MNTRKMWKLIFIAPFAIVGIAALVALAVAVGGEVVKLLWNWLLPPLFGFREITFWQALGILLLCRILFGGLGGWRGSQRSNTRGRVADRLADRLGDRWDAMTPEERERFRQRIRERCGFDVSTSESKGH